MAETEPVKDGGPAFPLQSIGPDFVPGYCGMSLRDYFAAAALQGLIQGSTNPKNHDDWARCAYALADAMISERNKTHA